MALNQNQFALSTVVGTKVSGINVLPCEFYSATPSEVAVPGQAVIIAANTAPNVTRVAKGGSIAAKWFGVVLTNPLKSSWASGEKLEVAFGTSIVMMTASTAITAGAHLAFDPSTLKVATATTGQTVIGIAMENAAVDGDLIRVMIDVDVGGVGATGATGATGPTGP